MADIATRETRVAGNGSNSADGVVAVYWDFENVHACLLDQVSGTGTYRSTAKFKAQDPIVDITRVAQYAAGFGRVVVHRAYANWQHFARYRDSLHAHAIDLVQLFPLAGTKNAADIRLALDVAEDLRLQPAISHVVVVGSDSDYTPLAQRCRSYGKRFVGIGTAKFVAAAYPWACDEFRRYEELPSGRRPAALASLPQALDQALDQTLGQTLDQELLAGRGLLGQPPVGDETGPFDQAAALVEVAIRRLAAEHGGPWVLKAALRPMVRRVDPSFDEAALGFASFTDLLNALADRVAERPGRYDHELAVRADLPPADAAGMAARTAGVAGYDEADLAEGDPDEDLDAAEPVTPVSLIEWQLKKKKQRLPADRRLLWWGPGLIADIFAASETGIESGFDSLFLKFAAEATQLGITVREPEFRKLKTILWRAFAFQPLPDGQGLLLRVRDRDELRLRMVSSLLRLLPDPVGADPAGNGPEVLAEALFGPGASAEQQDLIRAARADLAAGGPAWAAS